MKTKLLLLCTIVAMSSVVVLAQDPPNLANGMPPQGSYDGGSVDTVNLMNGNLTLHIPIPVSTPQRGKLGVQYYLVVNAKTWIAVGDPNTLTGQWQPTTACSTQPPTPSGPCGQTPLFVSTASFTMTRSYQKVFTDGQGTDYAVGDPDTLVTWDGSGHPITPTVATDTSGYQVQASGGSCSGIGCSLPYTGVIIDREGTQYSGQWVHDFATCSTDPGNGLPGSTQTTNCSEHFVVNGVTDANGNVLIAPLGIPDLNNQTNAPTVATHLASSSETSGCLTSFGTPWVGYLNYPAPSGQTNQIKLCFATYPQLSTSFSPSGIHQFQDVYSGRAFPGNYRQPVYLSNVILPDGTQWSISYDSYGEITSVAVPTGASIQYGWTEGHFPLNSEVDITSVSRAVSSRTVIDANGNRFTWNYQWGTPATDNTMTHTVTDPNNNDTVHVFKPIEAIPTLYPYNEKEVSTVLYQGTGSSRIALKQVDTTWQINQGGGLGAPTDVKTTIFPSQLVSLHHTDYDPNSPSFGLPISSKQYDWGPGGQPGALLKEVDTVYQWQNDPRYLTANILAAPASVITKDGSGNKVAETDYSYDEPAYLTSYEGTVGALPSGTHLAAPNPVRGNTTTASRWLNTGGTVVSHMNWYDTGEVFQSIDPLNNATTYSYDLAYQGALRTETCNAKSQCVSATYDANTGLLTSFTDANGSYQAKGTTQGDSAHTSTYSYDPMSRLTSAISPPDAGGNHPQTTFSYPNAITIQRLKSITPSLTDRLTTYLDGLGRVVSVQHAMPSGSPVTVNTTYDGFGRIVSLTNPFFSTSDPTYGITQTVRDALGRETLVTEQDGSVRSVSYSQGVCGTRDDVTTTDEAGNKRKTCSDALGRLLEVDEPNPGAAASYASGIVTINGSEQSNPQAGASGSGTVTIGGAEGASQTCTDPLPPRKPVCTTVWDHGSVSISVNGYSKSAGFGDQSTTPSTVAAALAGAFHNDTSSPVDAWCSDSFCTNPVITLSARTQGAATNYSLSAGPSASSGSDFYASASGANLTGGRDATSNPDTGTVTITVSGTNYTTAYGGGDNSSTIALRLAGLISAGAYANASNAGNVVTLKSKTSGPGGDYSLAASYSYDSTHFAGPSFTTSPSASSLQGGYNAGDPSNNPFVTTYQYTALGDLSCVHQKATDTSADVACSGATPPSVPAAWRQRFFTYDSLSRLLTAQNPESGKITYTYDANSNALSKTDARGIAVNYSYDSLNRVTQKTYSDGTPTVTYGYDVGCCGVNPQNGVGHMTYTFDGNTELVYVYDNMGRITTQADCPPSGISRGYCYVLTAAYDLAGDVTSLGYPDWSTITYTPDSAGRMVSAVDNASAINYVTGATFGPDNALTGFISGNSGSVAGIANTFSYNKRLQPVNMSASSPSQTVFSIGYDFHLGNADNGNVFGITNYRDNSRNQSFTYDSLNRLTSAQNAGTDCSKKTVNLNQTEYWGNSYSFDPWGNLLAKNVTKCTAENLSATALTNNQLSGYGYDAAGNMISDPTDGVTSTYDGESRIVTSTSSKTGDSASYTYNSLGNRVRKDVNGAASTEYFYFNGQIVSELNPATGAFTNYAYFDGHRVARRDGSTGPVSYYFSDYLKTASVVTDAAGNIKEDEDYFPWGGELQLVNNDSSHYKFNGKERDFETQLDYFGARYYSNALSRFVTPDWDAKPITVPYAHWGDPQSLNLYSYVRNNPTTFGDPDGHEEESDDDGVHVERHPDGSKTATTSTSKPTEDRMISLGNGNWIHQQTITTTTTTVNLNAHGDITSQSQSTSSQVFQNGKPIGDPVPGAPTQPGRNDPTVQYVASEARNWFQQPGGTLATVVTGAAGAAVGAGVGGPWGAAGGAILGGGGGAYIGSQLDAHGVTNQDVIQNGLSCPGCGWIAQKVADAIIKGAIGYWKGQQGPPSPNGQD